MKPLTRFRDDRRSGGDGPEMIVMPAGFFMMGSPEDAKDLGYAPDYVQGVGHVRARVESPEHRVSIATPFAMGRYAVTCGEFAAFVDATDHDMSGGVQVFFEGRVWRRDPALSWRNPGFEQDDRHPVVGVSRRDADAYCAWLSTETGARYRLPSEAEWEYACRAGSKTRFWFGDEAAPEQAHYAESHDYDEEIDQLVDAATAPVDAYAPNPWGLYQTHGNVCEICADHWHDNYDGAPSDGAVWEGGDPARAVIRGGAFDEADAYLRSAYRSWIPVGIRNQQSGFRVARSIRG